LNTYKGGELIEAIQLENKAVFIFGAHPKKSDVVL
jgi:hypothetical protein